MVFGLDTYILQIMIQQELEKLTKIFKENLILKANKFQSKLEIFTKLKKKKKKRRIASVFINVFGYEIKKKYQIYFQKTC